MTTPIEDTTVVSPDEPVDDTTPQQPIPDPAPTTPVEPPAPAGPPDGYVEQARFTGAIQKIEELTVANRDQATRLDTQTSELELLKLTASSKDQETTIVVGERDKLLNASADEVRALNTEVTTLRAYKRKVEMAKKMGRPELINTLHIIPDMEDDEALQAVMTDILGFRDTGVEQRERELTSGIIPSTTHIEAVDVKPTTDEGWKRYVNSFPTGSKERAAALEEQGDWMYPKPE